MRTLIGKLVKLISH